MLTVEQKQLVAIIAGGIAGFVCFIGLTMLRHRRLVDPRIRQTSTVMDLAVLIVLWVQLSLGLITLPFSFSHSDGSVMLTLSHWAQGILTLLSSRGIEVGSEARQKIESTEDVEQLKDWLVRAATARSVNQLLAAD